MLSLSGHIGAKASALVDGQLSAAEEERVWSHVLTCPGCRQLVEHEGYVKRSLGALSSPGAADPPSDLLGSLYAVDATAVNAAADAWAAVDQIERQHRRRRTTAVALGGGAVGACMLGLIAVTGGPAVRSDVPRPSPAMIRGDQPRGPVGSPIGVETDRTAVLDRRSR
jgi:anti-sigma factor RsiW